MRLPLLIALITAGCTSTDGPSGDGDTDTFPAAACDEPGAICTIAGQGGKLGLNGDGLAATATWLYFPSALDWTPDGALLIDDFNNMRVRELRDGLLTTVIGNGVHGWATPGAPATASELENPVDLAVAPDGAVYVAELHTSRILRVGDDGLIALFAGTGDEGFSGDGAPATSATFSGASGLAVAPDGRLFISDTDNHCVRVVELDGTVRSVAGDGMAGADDGTAARFHHPQRLVVDGDRLLVADADNHRVRAIDLLTGAVTTVAGTGVAGFSGDGGPATAAQLNQPYGVTTGPDGQIYVAEYGNHRVRRVDADGVLTTVAGTGEATFSGDGGPAADAALNGPADVLTGPDGALYIADMLNGVVRRVAP